MSAVMSPLHTGKLLDKSLRFFRAPLPGTHLPWHAWEDLQRCLDLDEDMQVYMRRSLMVDWSRDLRTVPTAEGAVIIAPHWMAAGIVAAIGEIRDTEPALTIAYQQQMFEAWAVLTGDMPARESMELLGIAVCNMLASRTGSYLQVNQRMAWEGVRRLRGHNAITCLEKPSRSADLAALTRTALAAILAHPEGAGHDEHASRMIKMLSNNTRAVAERAYGEFMAEDSWSVERRQAYSLNAIVAHVTEVRTILTSFGEVAKDAATNLTRETYFARLAEVALGARAGSGSA